MALCSSAKLSFQPVEAFIARSDGDHCAFADGLHNASDAPSLGSSLCLSPEKAERGHADKVTELIVAQEQSCREAISRLEAKVNGHENENQGVADR